MTSVATRVGRPLPVRVLLVVLLIAAKPAWGFEGTDVVFDANTGFEWLKVSESLGRSYDDLVGNDGSDEFAPGGDFEGFRHATIAEAETFLGNAGFDVLETPSAALIDEATNLILRLRGPAIAPGGIDTLFALTGDEGIDAGERARITITVDNNTGEGEAGENGSVDDAAASANHGHLLVRDAAPLPQRHVYVARSSSSNVAVIDVATNAVIDTVITGVRAVVLVASPDQSRVYTLNPFDSNVSVIDTATRTLVTTHPFTPTGSPRDIEISADGTTLFITDQADPGTVIAMDAVTGSVIDTVDVEANPYAIKRSVDGSILYVSESSTLDFTLVDVDTLTAVDATSGNFVQFAVDVGTESGRIYTARSSTLHDVNPVTLVSDANVAVGADIRGVAASERIGRVFASSTDDATVSVVDIDSFSVVTTVSTGTVALSGGIFSPGIDATEEGDLVYAAQGNNDTVAVLDTLSNQVIAEIDAGSVPIDVVVVPEPIGTHAATVAGVTLLLLAGSRREVGCV